MEFVISYLYHKERLSELNKLPFVVMRDQLIYFAYAYTQVILSVRSQIDDRVYTDINY